MDAFERFRTAYGCLSADEKRAVCRAMKTSRVSDVAAIVAAMDRSRRRKASDRATDRRRRVLVGARVPRELAEQVRRAAQARGVSVYRFIVDIIREAVS